MEEILIDILNEMALLELLNTDYQKQNQTGSEKSMKNILLLVSAKHVKEKDLNQKY